MKTNPCFQPYLMGHERIRAPEGSRSVETDDIEADLRQARGEGRDRATYKPCRRPLQIAPSLSRRATKLVSCPRKTHQQPIPQPPSDPAPLLRTCRKDGAWFYMGLCESSSKPPPAPDSIWEITCKKLDGAELAMNTMRGSVMLITNVASY